jgi:hypothetical protein
MLRFKRLWHHTPMIQPASSDPWELRTTTRQIATPISGQIQVQVILIAALARRDINFYNPVDYALGFWETDQDIKPAESLGYTYQGIFPAFKRGNTELSFPTGPPFALDWRDTYEIFSFADEARCYALGASADVRGVFDVQAEVLLDPDFAFGSAHKGHSAEFRSTNMKRAPFWDTLLRRFDLK